MKHRLRTLVSAPVLVGAVIALTASASCGTDGEAPTDLDGGLDADVRDARAKDAKVDAVVPRGDAGPMTCTYGAGWKVAAPFRPDCRIAIAPPELWNQLQPPMQPCNNGQPRCTELVFPNQVGMLRQALYVSPIEPGAATFLLGAATDPTSKTCTRLLNLRAEGDHVVVAGAAEAEQATACGNGTPTTSNLIVQNTKLGTPEQKGALAIYDWTTGNSVFETAVSAEFPEVVRTGSKIYPFDTFQSSYELLDIATKAVTKLNPPPLTIQQFLPSFAVDGDLWGDATYGEFGKSEVWRMDPSGAWSAMIQKRGVHIVGERSDGQTLFWVEASGNETAIFPQPKREIWSAPLSKSMETINATKRKLADVSGLGRQYQNTKFAVAHAGYYALEVGEEDFVVVRGSDGAVQKIHVVNGWAGVEPAYVDATQIWFGHTADVTKSKPSFARIALDPWP